MRAVIGWIDRLEKLQSAQWAQVALDALSAPAKFRLQVPGIQLVHELMQAACLDQSTSKMLCDGLLHAARSCGEARLESMRAYLCC